ncbi:MAG: hypothetical protein AAGI51_04885 [Pseudomonadota bacterium]
MHAESSWAKLCAPAALGLAAALGAAPGSAQEQTRSLDSEDVAREAQEEAAEEIPAPRFTWGLGMEVQNDFTFDADDPDAELNDLYPSITAELGLELLEDTGVFATLVLEPVLDPEDDRVFEDIGLYAEELFAQAGFGAVVVKGGKFNPAFGQAWDAPGIYGGGFAGDYELLERIGGALSFDFEAAGGEHSATASVFMADRTFLSDSLFTDRGQLERDDGGPSNTGGPESVALALDGAFGDTGYTAGFLYQSGGRGDPGDELGFVAGLNQVLEAGPGELFLQAEAAYFSEYQAGPDDAVIATFIGEYGIDAVTVSAEYALRDVDGASTDHFATATVEYEFFEGLSAGIGYAYTREESEDSHTLGLLLVYEIGGGFGLGGL